MKVFSLLESFFISKFVSVSCAEITNTRAQGIQNKHVSGEHDNNSPQ